MSALQAPDAWHPIEQLLALRERLKKQSSGDNAALRTIKIQEVESMLYERLLEQGRPIVRGANYSNGLTQELKEAVLHEAVGKMFDAYAGFNGTARLKTYFSRVVQNLIIDKLRRLHREQSRLQPEEDELRRASERIAVEAFSESERVQESGDRLIDEAENIFDSMDLDRMGLTDKEFLAVVLKLASVCLMKKKVPDAELARKVNMKREAFVDAYLRGRNKVCRYLKGNGRP